MTKMKKSKDTIGSRIHTLRKTHSLTQAAFASLIAERTGRKKPYATMTVSSWERGERIPGADVIEAIAEQFGVSMYYLYRGTAAPDPTGISSFSATSNKAKIRTECYGSYIGKPVYMAGGNKRPGGWGILQMTDNGHYEVMTGDGTYPIRRTSDELYAIPHPLDIVREIYGVTPISYKRLLEIDHDIWVQMVSKDESTNEMYNGLYHLNDPKTALINDAGMVLPLAGYCKVFVPYEQPFATEEDRNKEKEEGEK